VKALVILDQIGNVDRAEPAAGDREHVEPHAKLPADDVDKLRLAAMGIEEDQLPASGPPDALADCEPRAAQRFIGEGQRPRKSDGQLCT